MFAQSPTSEGFVRGFTPTDNEEGVVQVFCLYYVMLLANYVLYSDDRETAASLFGFALDQLKRMERFADKNGLLDDSWKHWGFIDWALVEDKGTRSAVNAIYIMAHKKAIFLADYLGRENESLELKRKTHLLSKVFTRTFWQEKEGLFSDSILKEGIASPVRSQHANMLAVLAGLTEQDQSPQILKRIINPEILLPRTPGDASLDPKNKPQIGGIVQVGTPGMGHLLCQALFENGLPQEAIDYIRREWPRITVAGTIKEHYVEDKNTSYCHGWSSGPTMSLPAYILGIRPLKPGWDEVEICPQLGDLEWAEGSIMTPHGKLSVHCKKNGKGIQCEISSPPDMRVIQN
jgi:hypothetical protein